MLAVWIESGGFVAHFSHHPVNGWRQANGEK
jgi:hypothetical protein